MCCAIATDRESCRLPAAHVISAIGLGLSSTSASLPYVRKTCTFILSRQLLRPEGIRGLCESIFGEEEASGEDVALDKLEHVSRLLGTIPAGMTPKVSTRASDSSCRVKFTCPIGISQHHLATHADAVEPRRASTSTLVPSGDRVLAITHADK